MNQTDHHNQEQLAAWSRRLTYPVLNALDKDFKGILSGEFAGRINPDAYRIPDKAIALLLCSDERLNNLNLDKIFENKREDKSIFPVRLPGAVAGQDIEKLKEKLRDFDFSKLAVASHADCGAAGLDLLGKGLSVDTDQYAQDLVSDLPGIENWGFIDREENPELAGMHTASCFLYDGTGKRNYIPDGVLPSECFILNRAVYSDVELAKQHMEILIKIALEKHGLGSFFSKEHPFYIFVSAINDEDLRKYMNEAEEVVKILPRDLVKVVGFIAPRMD